MSLKRTFFILGLVLFLMHPVGEMLRNANPWSCFGFTFDENFFAQAAANFARGAGYRIAESKPFDPLITVGVPVAWGASFIASLTGKSIAIAGRFFVHLTFVLILLALARSAFRAGRQWLAVPLAVGIFVYGISKTSFGSYFAFGYLGEMPAILAGVYAFRSLDERKPFRAGLAAGVVFVLKPTFLFFLPAVLLASFLTSRRDSIRTFLAMGIVLTGAFLGIASARGENLFAYLSTFYEVSSRIARQAPGGSLFELYPSTVPSRAVFAGLFVIFGAACVAFRRKPAPAAVAAFLLFVSSALYYLVLGVKPVEKQWDAIFALTLAGFAPVWAATLADRFAGFAPREFVRGIVLAIIATWILTVGPVARHTWLRVPETACPAKEQAAIDRRLDELSAKGEATRENTIELDTSPSYDRMAYSLAWYPAPVHHWNAVPTNMKWVFGETRTLFPEPSGCVADWKGENFSLLNCSGRSIARPAPNRPGAYENLSRDRSAASTRAGSGKPSKTP